MRVVAAKNRFRNSLFLAAGAAAVFATIPKSVAQTPKDGHKMIDSVVAALGGDRFLNLHVLERSGRVYAFFHDRLSGLELFHSYTEYLPKQAKATDLDVRERELLGKKQDYSYLFLPDQAFDVTYRGARPIPDESWDRYQRTTHNDVLYILRCRLNEQGLEIDYMGTDIYLGRHVEVVDITDAANQTIHIMFDHNTMFPLHETYTWFDDKTREHNDESTDYDKFRDVGGGIMWPYVIEREHNGYKTYQMFAESAQANPSLPKDIFELPAGAKMLKKVQ